MRQSPTEGGVGAAMRQRLAGFVRTLRDNGYAVGLAETSDALAILSSPAAARMHSLTAAFRALFCASHSDWEKFDEVFAAFFSGRGIRWRTSAGSLAPANKAPQ